MNTTIRKEFVDTFNKLTHKLSPWEVWKDFVVMCSCSFSNALDKSHYDEREKLYMDTIKKYDKEDQAAFQKLLAYTVMALEENPDQDFLGTIYTELGLVNKQYKQIFTPYNVNRLMAEITMENVAQEVKEKGYITLNDDCCGAGSTLIAGVNTIKSILEKQRLNFQNHLLVAAQDIDLTVGLMCYIQLSLLGVAAYIKIDDAISKPMAVDDTLENYWFTPMYFSEVWKTRRMIKQVEQLFKEDK